jgi:hypothetical protein
VLAGIGVEDVVAVTPSPTVTYISEDPHTKTPCGPATQVPVDPAVPVYDAVLAGKFTSLQAVKSSIFSHLFIG